MSRRTPEPWETSAGAPYVAIRAGGPLDGIVTLTATGAEGHVSVSASWGGPYSRASISAERVDHAAADELAHAWADELAAGRTPTG
ncbi:MAG TPA: hypothetical protein VGK33_20975 [Chloroflexota bacterium]